MVRGIDNYYLSKSEPNRSCLLAMQYIILKHDEKIRETLKWNIPCFYYEDKVLCYLWLDTKTKEPLLLMEDGHLIEHHALEETKYKNMKLYRIDANKDLELKSINTILEQGITALKR